jgi:hypothetical protein
MYVARSERFLRRVLTRWDANRTYRPKTLRNYLPTRNAREVLFLPPVATPHGGKILGRPDATYFGSRVWRCHFQPRAVRIVKAAAELLQVCRGARPYEDCAILIR